MNETIFGPPVFPYCSVADFLKETTQFSMVLTLSFIPDDLPFPSHILGNGLSMRKLMGLFLFPDGIFQKQLAYFLLCSMDPS